MIQTMLVSLQDPVYRAFQCKLMPTVDPASVIGVRIPALRKLAKEIAGSAEVEEFLRALPHRYYDENNLHAFLIEQIRTYDACVAALDAFLPYVDNWATCDLINPKVLGQHFPELERQIRIWMVSEHPYTVRFGMKLLMTHFLGEHFSPDYPEWVAEVHSDEYYVNMMIAWYFATALAKQYDVVVPYLQARRLSKWVHNKTVQKAIESFRITQAQKAYLKTLKIK